MRPLRVILLCMMTLGLLGPQAAGAAVPPPPWQPLPGTSWQWQLSGTVDQSVDVEVYNIDLFENGSQVVSDLHDAGRKVICYMSAGSFENWRPDASDFPANVKGRTNGWPGERWLDIRRLGVLKPIMRERLDLCRTRGYDGVEFDNVEGYANRSGFPLTRGDQRFFNEWLAKAAHERGLGAGLKNDLSQIEVLEPHFDFAVNEQCYQYRECGQLTPFIDNDKAVLHVEYVADPEDFCSRTTALGFSSLRKRWALGTWRIACA
ncbi:MAG: endo alpha-1,4 polygalactosaminidase [Actinomycetota bacterium]|nr:endo alpha-1,4 polygalactosaminidase [Actinomycetota bacterium]